MDKVILAFIREERDRQIAIDRELITHKDVVSCFFMLITLEASLA
jgi:hypothetical protein